MLPPTGTHNQVYRTARGYRILIYVLMSPLILLFLALPFLLMQGKNPSATISAGVGLLGLGLAGFLTYGLLETVKGRFTIGPREVTQVSALKTKTLVLNEIKGYRLDQKYTYIFPKDAQLPTLKIGSTTERYAEIEQWLHARYPDLDQLETQQATAALLEDQSLGHTPEERANALAKARKIARGINIAGGAIGGWLFLYPHPYQWAVTAGLVLPLLATAALWIWPNLIRVDEKKNSGYPSVVIAFLATGFGLLMRAMLDHELVSHAPMWPLMGTVATGIAVVLAIGSRQFLFRSGSTASVGSTIVLLALLFGYGATSMVNAVYDDDSQATTYTPQVLSKRISSGRHTSYHLEVSAWGPIAMAKEVTVSSDYYWQVQPGQQVTIALWPGRLGVPWFMVLE